MTTTDRPASFEKIWETDNPPSRDWPLYTRGNVGEVFPEVVLPFTWSLLGKAAEDGWRQAFVKMGLTADGDISDDESMVILSVFGGYCYINASYVRLLGVRAPGGKVENIDSMFFGESDAPAYESSDGDKNLKSSFRLAKTVLRLLRTKSLPDLEHDKAKADRFVARYPGDDAGNDELLAYCRSFSPFFEHLFFRHIDNTFSNALVSGALIDLIVKAGKPELLVSVLGGIGDIESAAPSAAMWELSRLDPESDEYAVGFERFIRDHGTRGPNEWDIGSDPWAFRPAMATAAIDSMRAADDTHAPVLQARRLAEARADAIAEVKAELNPIDRFQFDKSLAATALYSQARERSKTTVIKVIHAVRRAQRAMHDRTVERGGVAERWKSCLLNVDEFERYLDDPAQFTDLIEQRAELHERLAGLIPPFIVDGVVPGIDTWGERSGAADQMSSGQTLQGIAGCPGVARGRARVVLDAGDPGDLGPGDVLIAPITDPSWTPLFLAAEAVVVDVGATMSHAVIVSRELGIPCVVSAVGATRSIPDGAEIEVDGNTGVVTVL
ncbi:PEP-utilizing enzyme [Ilumatobacter nonamiensis]|uniref:PEP-utilizing enzyme n=1 Tax=Ilumatobacter nonamiensis TaxID=467093 RepID=UPI000686AF02|nr:PEP-utilizing enzyme [Ilumatobacter nonamiensis]